ncbi:MAG: DUF6311 domain-containing protein [Lachnospiraceae bacterium]|nr:DUF6311 domain-containing protein [Lachnospiraceae bacterium]
MKKGFAYKRRYSFLTGATVGAVVFFLIYGFAVIIPTNVTWLHHSVDLEGLADLTQHELGWEMYRNCPWMFPIGLFYGLSPEPLSIVYTDSVPLFAIIFKLLSPVLPQQFQYMGIFELITYVLMGGFGALIADRFSGIPASDTYKKGQSVHARSKDRPDTVRRVISAICMALLMVTSPVLTKRVFYHTALSAHFLLLGAILIVIYKNELGRLWQRGLFILLVTLCTLINAYYIPMVMGIYGCSILYGFMIRHRKSQQLIDRDRDIKKDPSQLPEYRRTAHGWAGDLVALLISGVSALIWGALLGMFSGTVSSSAENMEDVSYNLNGLFNPRNEILIHLRDMPLYDYRSSESYSLFFKGFNVYTPWQSEGFSYLGLGVILLAVIAIISSIRDVKSGKLDFNIKMAESISFSGLVFLLLAMGPMGTLAGHRLYHIPWPDAIYRLLSVFRTTGRFIWVIWFGLTALLVMYATWSKKTLVQAALVVCTVLQLIDISPSLIHKHEVYGTVSSLDTYKNELETSEAFSYLAQRCDEILFVNPTTAIRMRPYWSTVFEEYAIDNGMSMNAAYCSRDTTKIADAYSDDNQDQRRDGKRFPEILYVFINEEIMEQQAHKFDLNVYKYDNIYIGSDLDLSGFAEFTEVTR